jgi:hypothetical protein
MKSKAVCHAAVIALGLSVLGTAPAWSQSLIGDGIPAERDPYASAYRGYHPQRPGNAADAGRHGGAQQRHF